MCCGGFAFRTLLLGAVILLSGPGGCSPQLSPGKLAKKLTVAPLLENVLCQRLGPLFFFKQFSVLDCQGGLSWVHSALQYISIRKFYKPHSPHCGSTSWSVE